MAIIKNTGIKRGDKLTATDLNAEFAAVNTGFPMNEDNVRNEGVDYKAFDTGGSGSSTGKNGVILVDANGFVLQTSGTSTIVRENTSVASDTAVGDKTGLSISAVAGDILRVYWQAQVTTSTTSSGYPTGTSGIHSTACWVHRLQWQINGSGSYVDVPGQSDLNQTIDASGNKGTIMDETIASALVNSAIYHKNGSGTPTLIDPAIRTSYGSYYYKFTGSTTINAFRIVARGLFMPIYVASGGGNPAYSEDKNCLQLLTVSTAQQITFNQVDLNYLLMRSE